tara:strand:- start:318 stop:533 length:216 start_codon:yes stop_codon:yes gene_type:complete
VKEENVRQFSSAVEGRKLDKVGLYLNDRIYLMNISTAIIMAERLSSTVHESKDSQIYHLNRKYNYVRSQKK